MNVKILIRKVFGIPLGAEYEDLPPPPPPPRPPKGDLGEINSRTMTNNMINDLLLIRDATENRQLKEIIQTRLDEICQYVLEKNKSVELRRE